MNLIERAYFILKGNSDTFQVIAIEVGATMDASTWKPGFQKIDILLKSVNYTKVHHMVRGLDNIYVRNDLRSAYFGINGNPKLMPDLNNRLNNNRIIDLDFPEGQSLSVKLKSIIGKYREM